MGRRTLVELFYIVAGLVVAAVMTRAAMEAYPLARDIIRWCGIGAMAATVAMGVRPLVRAHRIDRAAR